MCSVEIGANGGEKSCNDCSYIGAYYAHTERQGSLSKNTCAYHQARRETLFRFIRNTILQHFKTKSTDATEQLESLRINGELEDDEYDMIDDSDDPAPERSQQHSTSKSKYSNILQEVADRTRTNIVIDLDDLEEVQSTLNP